MINNFFTGFRNKMKRKGKELAHVFVFKGGRKKKPRDVASKKNKNIIVYGNNTSSIAHGGGRRY
tara:strand:+ start:3554 stop:3745 length:192 start_codon:yes stop_codon:yes gene_type:complete